MVLLHQTDPILHSKSPTGPCNFRITLIGSPASASTATPHSPRFFIFPLALVSVFVSASIPISCQPTLQLPAYLPVQPQLLPLAKCQPQFPSPPQRQSRLSVRHNLSHSLSFDAISVYILAAASTFAFASIFSEEAMFFIYTGSILGSKSTAGPWNSRLTFIHTSTSTSVSISHLDVDRLSILSRSGLGLRFIVSLSHLLILNLRWNHSLFLSFSPASVYVSV